MPVQVVVLVDMCICIYTYICFCRRENAILQVVGLVEALLVKLLLWQEFLRSSSGLAISGRSRTGKKTYTGKKGPLKESQMLVCTFVVYVRIWGCIKLFRQICNPWFCLCTGQLVYKALPYGIWPSPCNASSVNDASAASCAQGISNVLWFSCAYVS